jgi:hypothetical protein
MNLVSSHHVSTVRIIVGSWQAISGMCLLALAGGITWIGRSSDGVGVPLTKPVILCFSLTPFAVVGLTLWTAGWFGTTVFSLLMATIGYMAAGIGLLLDKAWAIRVAVVLCALNAVVLSGVVFFSARWTTRAFPAVKEAAVGDAIMMIVANTISAIYLLRT